MKNCFILFACFLLLGLFPASGKRPVQPAAKRSAASASVPDDRQQTPIRKAARHRTPPQTETGTDARTDASPQTPQTQPGNPQGPLLRFDDAVHDFGDVARKGGDVSHDFVFRNAGDRPLVVVRVITSCSCVKASFPKRPVAPGQTGVLRITYQPHKSEPGAFNKVIQIFSNSAAGRDVVTVQGHSIDKRPSGKSQTKKQQYDE